MARASWLNDNTHPDLDAHIGQLEHFTQSIADGVVDEKELAAIIECTDIEFLPPSKKERMDKAGGREKLQERLTAIKQILEER